MSERLHATAKLSPLVASVMRTLDGAPTTVGDLAPGDVVDAALLARRRKLVRFGVPAKDHDAILADTLAPRDALCHARRFFAAREKRVLVLGGLKGTGKTTAAGWLVAKGPPLPPLLPPPGLVRAARLDDWPAECHPRFISASDLQSIGLYDRDAQAPLRAASVLAIDDLGIEFSDRAEVFKAVLEAILDARCRALLWTVLTTNVTKPELFANRYGARTHERVLEFGVYVVAVDRVREPRVP